MQWKFLERVDATKVSQEKSLCNKSFYTKSFAMKVYSCYDVLNSLMDRAAREGWIQALAVRRM